MDKDRIKGAAQQAKGSLKKAVGRVTRDSKLKTEGALDQAAGKMKNTIGGLKDAARQSERSAARR